MPVNIDQSLLDKTENCVNCGIGFVDKRYRPLCSLKCKGEYAHNILLDKVIGMKNIKVDTVKELRIKIKDLFKFKSSSSYSKYNLTKEQYHEITKQCVICNYTDLVELHHIKPLSEGGLNVLSNYVGLCPNHHRLAHKKNKSLCQVNGRWIL